MTSKADAAKELRARRRARDSLLSFTEYTLPTFESGRHHAQIADSLERVEKGECKRLMIFAPPRHTKSELSSRRFPAWFLGRNPSKQIIATTYGHDLASDFGRDVRNIIKSGEYSKVFKTELRADSQSANRWHTDADGVYVATGVGGSITGRGANIALIDDPFKNREDADSELKRETVWNWYTSTLYTRLMPGGAIILIMTRWHEDDLAGRLLEAQKNGGDQWEVIDLKAISNEGQPNEAALWPEWYDLEYLKQVKKVVGPRDWSALYQQSPTADEGTFFKREWFNRYSLGEQPKTNKYQSTDFAVTDGGGDYTELGIIGLCAEMDLWVEDWWSGQESSDVWVNAMLDQIEKHSPLCSFGETGVIRRAVEPLFRMFGKQRRVYPRIEWITRTGDKAAIARALQGMAANGKVHIPKTEWGDRLIEQLVAFPAGKHDDAVDVLALFALAVQTANPAILVDISTNSNHTDAWGRFKRSGSDSWRI
jgi:predicted phage terminase large subunit-like protein